MISEKLKNKLYPDSKIVVLTGAGISAESGVPTFRGENGLWKKFKPEELATVEAFLSNPQLVWEWYEYRRKLISQVEPNLGHFALADFQNFFTDFTLITQNVDGLHQLSGLRDVIELHGNIKRNKCIDCGKKYDSLPELKDEVPPACHCGGKIRPDVVWFGEMLPEEAINSAYQKSANCDVFFSIGTSSLVYPAASLPYLAKRNNAYLVEINIEKTELSFSGDEVLLGKSGEILPEIANLLKRKI
jgi:NAD-dependent deacetylase